MEGKKCLLIFTSLAVDLLSLQTAEASKDMVLARSDNPAALSGAPSTRLLDRQRSNLVRFAEASEPKITAGNPASTPFKWNGLWQGKTKKGWATCTGQFITARVVLLAAHCVQEQFGGEWWEEGSFLLQYQNDFWTKRYKPLCTVAPGRWAIKLLPGEDVAKRETITDARTKVILAAVELAHQYDYAFVYVDADSITGHYNYHVNERWNGATTVGYPGAMMGGAVMQEEPGDVFDSKVLTFSGSSHSNVQVLWQDQANYTFGASGGAWVANLSANEGPGTNIVVGVNSFINPKKPGAVFGPIFNDVFDATLKKFEADCSAKYH